MGKAPIRQPGGQHKLRSAIAAAIFGLSIAPPGFAEVTRPLVLHLDAQPLQQAIETVSETFDVNVLAPGSLLDDRRAPAISGSMTGEEAIRRLLRGSGLRARRSASGDIVISADPESALPKKTEPIMLAPIMVQGELISRSLQDTQTSVAVIAGEELERRADGNLFDVIERTAGASLGAEGERIVIRGVPETGVGNGAPVITKRVDGAVVDVGRTTFNATNSTWDLRQIEVLRGPQSTQTGRNALAGAVEIRSNDPTYDPEIKVRTAIGNENTGAGAFAVNVPLIEDTAALRVSLDRQRTDGFVTNPTLGEDDYDSRDDMTLRAGLRVDPTDDLTAIFKYTRIESESSANGPAIEGSLFPGRRVSVVNESEREDTTLSAGNLRVFYDFSESLRLENETTYTVSNTSTVLDFDNSAAPLSVFTNEVDSRSLEQELKLLYTADRVRAVLGGFFAKDDSDFQSVSTLPGFLAFPGLPPTLIVSGTLRPSGKRTNYAVFGEAEIGVLPALTLIAGGRYDHQKNEGRNVTTVEVSDPAFAPLLPPSATTKTKVRFDAFLPKLGLVYDFTDDASLGFTVQRGYRAGGASFNTITGVQNEFDPEFTWNFELALRSQWLDERLTVNANVFYTDWNDQQVAIFGTSGSPFDFRTENAGSSRLFGGEIEVRAQPLDNLDLFAGFGYANTEFTDFVSGGNQLAGNEFPFASKYTASFEGTYYFDMGTYVSVDASYQSKAYGDVDNTEARETDGRFLVNARLGYDAERWSVTAYVNNLFDKDYVTTVGNAVAGRDGLITAGDPRAFGVIGQVRF